MTQEEIETHLLGVVTSQYFSLKASLKQYGSMGETAITKELIQLYDMETYIPIDPDAMTP